MESIFSHHFERSGFTEQEKKMICRHTDYLLLFRRFCKREFYSKELFFINEMMEVQFTKICRQPNEQKLFVKFSS